MARCRTSTASGQKDGVYFQYWDPASGRPAYNVRRRRLTAPRLRAGGCRQKNDIKLIVVLLNNWHEFGGVDQYLTWYGKSRHHEFFHGGRAEAGVQGLARARDRPKKTALTAVFIAMNPTVFSWELANEPRCNNGGSFDSASGWDKTTLTGWAGEMSAYVKSLDSNHLVSVGDEGFLDGGGQHWGVRGERTASTTPRSRRCRTSTSAPFTFYPEDWAAPGRLRGKNGSWITCRSRAISASPRCSKSTA